VSEERLTNLFKLARPDLDLSLHAEVEVDGTDELFDRRPPVAAAIDPGADGQRLDAQDDADGGAQLGVGGR
jgi:hypothetical protein